MSILALLASLLAGCSDRTEDPQDALTLGISPGSRILDLEPGEREAWFEAMASLGAEWVRIDLDWSRIEPEPGVFEWETPDSTLDAAKASGLEVLMLVTYSPSWARPSDSSNKPPPIDVDDFAAFVTQAADRYGSSVGAWEIWNEPNVADFWEPGADPHTYARLFDASAAAIRRELPESTVITGGLAPASDDGDDLSPLTFLSEFYRYVEPGTADAVGVHPYTFPARPSDGGRNNSFRRLPEIADLVAEHEGHVVPLWLTEFGAPTGTSDRAVSSLEQAEIIGQAMRCVRSDDALGPLFLYNFTDPADGDPADREDNFGLIGADGDPKPAWDVVVEVLSETDTSDPCDS